LRQRFRQRKHFDKFSLRADLQGRYPLGIRDLGIQRYRQGQATHLGRVKVGVKLTCTVQTE